jgi:hypothetical protein
MSEPGKQLDRHGKQFAAQLLWQLGDELSRKLRGQLTGQIANHLWDKLGCQIWMQIIEDLENG